MRSQEELNTNNRPFNQRHEAGEAKVVLLLLAGFLAGAALGGFWIYRSKRGSEATAPQGPRLTDATKQVLRSLTGPVEIRMYSILPRESAPASLIAFAGRVDELVSEYEREAGNRLKVTRLADLSDQAASTAAADGIRGFNLDKGAACFLGITVARNESRQVLPQLLPEWENAFESDLTRAILSVTQTEATMRAGVGTASAQSNALEAVAQAIPNLSSASYEEGRKILRERAMKELKTATAEMQARIAQAQQRLATAQSGSSEAELQAAMKDLQEAQAQQSDKLKQMAAEFQAQLAALGQLKQEQTK